jgi:murein DD-endopeptidase MepM/ murein hydrolase activator NlpD
LTVTIIDISYWQQPTELNYDKLCASIDGAILRCAYGVRKDTAFERHYSELTARGVPVGYYAFLVEYKPVPEQIAVHKAAVAGKRFALGRWCDVELESGADPLTAKTVIDYMTRSDAEIGETDIYTGNWCWGPIMGTEAGRYSNKRLWAAAYSTLPIIPQGWSNWFLWQYTSSGKLDGYAGNLDMNKYNGTDAEYHAWVGGTVEPVNIPEKLYYPLPEGYPVSQRFGANPSWYPTSKGHNGVDWACLVGTPVYAMQDGTVIIAEARQEKSGYGRQVRIQHEQGISIYGHLSSLSVKAGDKVTAKQQVGTSGGATDDPCSGMSTGPHLHAEYRLTAGAPQVPGGYVYGAIDIYPLLAAHEEDNLTELYKAKCIVSGLRIRSGPSTTYSIIGYATKDRVYSVYAEEGTWMRISGTANHWVMGVPEYMQVTGMVTDVDKLARLWAAHPELW